MGLETYPASRDSTRTPEPKGKLAKRNLQRFFVKEHHDSTLHFDFMLKLMGGLILLLCTHNPAAGRQAHQSLRVTGNVLDQTKAPIPHAQVSLSHASTLIQQVITDDAGQFVFEGVTLGEGTLIVRADGFATTKQSWSAVKSESQPLIIVLAPAPITEQVAVTAARTQTRIGETAASIVVLDEKDLSATAALTLDDALRQVPGFQLFRRSGSRTANPTSQGVSLRGVGASGASRAVVLYDGVPIGDPFGGWVYWGRVPRAAISRVEVLRGGASGLYGSDALGGVVSIITREPEAPALSLEVSYGNQRTPDATLFAGGRKGKWRASLSGEMLSTDGYAPVDESERGRVDTLSGARHSALDIKLQRELGKALTVFARASYFGEARKNGTPLQTNRTHLRQWGAGGDWQSAQFGNLAARAYGGTQLFDQNFTAVAADRNSETLTRVQRVPAQVAGLGLQWSRTLGERQTIVAGFEAREVRGASNELAFVQGKANAYISTGGRERSAGLFVEDLLRVTSRLLLTGGARFDRWRNYAALAATQPVVQSGAATMSFFADRTETAFSPQLSALYQLNEHVSLSATGYRAFRAPTLNELYRSFRVGDVLTQANERLRAEHLTGGEAGANFTAPRSRFGARAALFWTEITSPVSNVTLSVRPGLITRQRQNLGRTRSRGVEIEIDARPTSSLFISGGYLFSDATVTRFPSNAALEGLRVPQVARHQLTFQIRYASPKLIAVGLQGRLIGAQYDDDQNLFALSRAFTLDAFASRRLTRDVELFLAAENLFNQRYQIGRTPVTTLGSPLLARVGLRLNLGAR